MKLLAYRPFPPVISIWQISLLVCFALLPFQAFPGIPETYYDSVSTSSGAALKSSLNAIVSSGSLALGYDNTWDPLRMIDESPTSSGAVQLIYGAVPRNKFAGSDLDLSATTGGWNREHGFPQSFFNQDEPMRSDLHSLFPADSDVNTHRSNSPYDYVTTPTYTDALGNRGTTQVFEPADIDKGRVARAILYMDMRYAGLNGEPDLTITNSYPGGTGFGQMAYLDTLLIWHRQYPPTAFERARNYKTFVYQHNANPFVDHPEWVSPIFGGSAWSMEDGNTLTVGGDSPTAANIAAGATNVPILILPTETQGHEVHLASITVENIGTVPDDNIAAINMWFDTDGNGLVSAPDSLLATSQFSENHVSLTPAHPFPLPGGFNQLLFTADLKPDTQTSTTLQWRIPANSMALSATGCNDIAPTFDDIYSSQFTITNPLEATTGLLITEVFEGTLGNLKYVELYNPTTSTVNLAGANLKLRRYTNGGLTPTVISLAGNINPDGFFVLANNAPEFQGAFGFAPTAASSEISHNGNDCYDLYDAATSVVVDTFAADRIGDSSNFAADRVAHRMLQALPNSGQWGTAPGLPADNGASPSGNWRVRTITSDNGNAAEVGSPGSLDEQHTRVSDWMEYNLQAHQGL